MFPFEKEKFSRMTHSTVSDPLSNFRSFFSMTNHSRISLPIDSSVQVFFPPKQLHSVFQLMGGATLWKCENTYCFETSTLCSEFHHKLRRSNSLKYMEKFWNREKVLPSCSQICSTYWHENQCDEEEWDNGWVGGGRRHVLVEKRCVEKTGDPGNMELNEGRGK